VSARIVMMKISVCIPTYRRLDRLEAVLEDLCRQELVPDQVVVVDNDAAGSARAVIDRRRAEGAPYQLEYDIQPERNIARTRNRTVALARGTWFAFIDDDERAPAAWLRKLLEAAETFQADGVLSPVEPQVPESAPDWIRRGRFYDFPHEPHGARVSLNRMRFGNVLLRGDWMRAEPGPFDERYGLMMGEDCDVLVRLAHKGAKIVWSEEAPVFEPVEAKRLSLRWLLHRAFTGGQEFARLTVTGKFRQISAVGRGMFFARVIAQILIAFGLTAVCLPLGRHRAAAWLVKAWSNMGKLSTFWGVRSVAYT
jgi:succinoglycan biosynthesis protein ExoM